MPGVPLGYRAASMIIKNLTAHVELFESAYPRTPAGNRPSRAVLARVLLEIMGLAVLTGGFKFECRHGFDGLQEYPPPRNRSCPQ